MAINQELATPYRFVVYLQDNGSSFLPNRRVIVTQFRRQSKGYGAATLRILSRDTFRNQFNFSQVGETFFRNAQWGEPRPAQRFAIIDASGLEQIPERLDSLTEAPVVFTGRIRNIAYDKFKDKSDYLAEATGDEDGVFYFTEAMYNCQDIPFNAVVNECYIANKVKDELSIEKYNPKKLKDSEVSELKWPEADQEYVWSLEDACRFVATIANVDIKFPWEADEERIKKNNDAINVPEGESLETQANYISPAANKQKYKIFLDKEKPRSYSSPYGKSLCQWLDENLLDNFTYRFYYISAANPTVQLVNTSLVDTELFPKAILPHEVVLNNRVANFSVTEVAETFTQVEVKSDRILFAGTFTTKNFATGQKTIDRNWTYDDEKKFAYGHDTFGFTSNPDAYRASWKNKATYSEFKFVKVGNCPIVISNPMDFSNEYTERKQIPFFPFVGVKESDGSLTISSEMNSHQTPDISTLKWATQLPYGYSASSSKYNLFEPFVSITITAELEPNNKDILHLQGGADAPQVDYSDNILIKHSQPQTWGYVSNDAKLFEINGSSTTPSDCYDWALGSNGGKPDPSKNSLGEYPNFTHWSMIYVTAAGYSDQRISLFKLKDNPGISTRRKVIEADDCQYWIAHAGAFKPITQITASTTRQGYDYVPEVVSNKLKVIRNDYKKQKAYLDMISAYLFMDKRAITIDYTLDGWVNDYQIGMPITSVRDTQTVTTNSTVESIEYFIQDGMPRIRVSTLIPELPPMKKFSEQIRITSATPQMSRLSTYKEQKVETVPEDKRINVTRIEGSGGGVGFGGGSALPASHLYQVIGGNTIPYLGSQGIKKINSAFSATIPISAANGIPTTLPDGLGWIRSIDDNSFKLSINDSTSLIDYDLVDQPVFAVVAPPLSGDNSAFTVYRIIGAL